MEEQVTVNKSLPKFYVGQSVFCLNSGKLIESFIIRQIRIVGNNIFYSQFEGTNFLGVPQSIVFATKEEVEEYRRTESLKKLNVYKRT
jgi:hypothetical protein